MVTIPVFLFRNNSETFIESLEEHGVVHQFRIGTENMATAPLMEIAVPPSDSGSWVAFSTAATEWVDGNPNRMLAITMSDNQVFHVRPRQCSAAEFEPVLEQARKMSAVEFP